MYADEADQDGEKQFLVFAAIFIPVESALELHQFVESARAKYGFQSDHKLKFSSSSAPKSVDLKSHTELKNSIVAKAAELDCKACCYLVPHDIAKGQPHETRLKFGVNTLLGKFDQFLRENGRVPGAVFFDRTTDYDQSSYFEEVFRIGIEWKSERKKLTYIISINSTHIGLSNLSSVTDIVVGAFRWVINEPDKDKVGALLLKSLSGLLWGVSDSTGTLKVGERGLCIRPRTRKHSAYEADIQAFISRLNQYQKMPEG